MRFSMKDLVDHLNRSGVVTSKRVREALLKVDRRDFCSILPYEDTPEMIGFNATISAPHMHAIALEAALPFLQDDGSQRVLDIGSGSGYLTVAFAELIGPRGQVFGVEHIQNLVDSARDNTQKHFAHFLTDKRVQFVCGDGRRGFEPGAPYDLIHVGAACEEIPRNLINQLKVGGGLILPIGAGGYIQFFRTLKKVSEGGELVVANDGDIPVQFVPLTDPDSQLRG